ncbi:MAG: FAD-dependent monooxygenase [Coriobacteriia bacterium]
MSPNQPRREHYSVIVAGAGPAGVFAAYHASARGPVLLVESGSLPRYKSCGGMLHDVTLNTLKQYGQVPESIALRPRTVHFRYNDWDRKVLKPCSLEFLNVDRAGFDEWLTTLLPADVEVVSECAVRDVVQNPDGLAVVLRSGKEDFVVSCDNLIGADGGRSQVRRALGVKSTATYVTLQDFVRLEGDIEPYFDCIYMRGIGDEYAYSYVVPKGDVAIVGSVYYPKTKHPWARQDQTMDILRERIPNLGQTVSREACAALYLRSHTHVVPGAGRVLLTGEAGGFMSPTSGEGISYAVNSGRLAGMAVAQNSPDTAVTAYSALTAHVQADIKRKLRWLPAMESRQGKYIASFVPTAIVSKITEGL